MQEKSITDLPSDLIKILFDLLNYEEGNNLDAVCKFFRACDDKPKRFRKYILEPIEAKIKKEGESYSDARIVISAIKNQFRQLTNLREKIFFCDKAAKLFFELINDFSNDKDISPMECRHLQRFAEAADDYLKEKKEIESKLLDNSESYKISPLPQAGG